MLLFILKSTFFYLLFQGEVSQRTFVTTLYKAALEKTQVPKHHAIPLYNESS